MEKSAEPVIGNNTSHPSSVLTMLPKASSMVIAHMRMLPGRDFRKTMELVEWVVGGPGTRKRQPPT